MPTDAAALLPAARGCPTRQKQPTPRFASKSTVYHPRKSKLGHCRCSHLHGANWRCHQPHSSALGTGPNASRETGYFLRASRMVQEEPQVAHAMLSEVAMPRLPRCDEMRSRTGGITAIARRQSAQQGRGNFLRQATQSGHDPCSRRDQGGKARPCVYTQRCWRHMAPMPS